MIHNNPSPEILEKEMKIAEALFGTSQDPDQIPVSLDSWEKLKRLSPNTLLYEVDEKGEPVSWVVVLPTSRELMDKFLYRQISEKELLDMTEKADAYEALYLCSAITLPEHRNKGYARKLFEEAIKRIPLVSDFALFAWPTSQEGMWLGDALREVLGREIFVRH